jgi:hypothetical protein
MMVIPLRDDESLFLYFADDCATNELCCQAVEQQKGGPPGIEGFVKGTIARNHAGTLALDVMVTPIAPA